MEKGWLEVPDWLGLENAGGGVAAVSRPGGKTDLAFLLVDSPPGKNRSLMRLARSIDDSGTPAAGWTNWTEIPDWFSWENQGAGLAVGDIDGDGSPDVAVLGVDAPVGPNRGIFRVGRNLSPDGTLVSWSPWRDVPDWGSWENQGADVALADIDGDGRLEFVVAMIDNPSGLNRGRFRVGKGVDVDGNVAGWTDWQTVPDWFSWENQGCGVAVGEFNGSGTQDLILLQVDAPVVGLNQGFFKVGHDLRADGTVRGPWSSWLGIPRWFSWENQGAGISTCRAGGKQHLVTMMVDAPPGQKKAGGYQLQRIEEDPQLDGKWDRPKEHSGVLAVHAAVVPGGKVLFFSGSGNSNVRSSSPGFVGHAPGVQTSAVWDPKAPSGSGLAFPNTLRAPDGSVIDFFCGGDTFLSDGRVLAAGGTARYAPPGRDDGWTGRRDALAFDVGTGRWAELPQMTGGRWYPSLIALGDGRVLAVSGLDADGRENNTIETLHSDLSAWRSLGEVSDGFRGLPLYAHIFLLADGRVFFSGGRMDDPRQQGPCIIDIEGQTPKAIAVFGQRDTESRNQSTSVLLPSAETQRVMCVGGGPEAAAYATDRVDIADLSVPAPAYRPADSLNLPRIHLNAVLLPDHTVFVSGGAPQHEFKPAARLQSEIYDVEADNWRIAATATVPRMYHSIALLLDDGSVVAAGGNPARGQSVRFEPPDANEEMRLEVYSPPYMFSGNRPNITRAPAQAALGSAVDVATAEALSIKWVTLIRNGATTHSFNTNQRLVDLTVKARRPQSLKVELPANENVLPIGFYMLFIVNDHGVPSRASWMRVTK